MPCRSSLAAQRLLDAVDDRELGGALLGFLQQALRLVEQARVLAAPRPCSRRRSRAGAPRLRRTRPRAREFSRMMVPRTRSPANIGTNTESDSSRPVPGEMRGRAASAARGVVAITTCAALEQALSMAARRGTASTSSDAARRARSIEAVRPCSLRLVAPGDADVAASRTPRAACRRRDRRCPGSRAPRPALLDAVDDREFGVALLGLLQQPLRLVEQARVLAAPRPSRRQRLQQPHVGFAERVLALVVLRCDQAETGRRR